MIPFGLALFISLAPIFFAMLAYVLARGKRPSTKEMLLLLSLATLTAYYIVTPDPWVLYVTGDMSEVPNMLILTFIASVLLFLTVYYFRRHTKGGGTV